MGPDSDKLGRDTHRRNRWLGVGEAGVGDSGNKLFKPSFSCFHANLGLLALRLNLDESNVFLRDRNGGVGIPFELARLRQDLISVDDIDFGLSSSSGSSSGSSSISSSVMLPDSTLIVQKLTFLTLLGKVSLNSRQTTSLLSLTTVGRSQVWKMQLSNLELTICCSCSG